MQMANLTEGDSVTGTYFGVEFTGTVRSVRGHSLNNNIALVHVDVEPSITVNGSVRTGLHMSLGWDGTEPFGNKVVAA